VIVVVGRVLHNVELLRLNFGVPVLHATQTASLLVVRLGPTRSYPDRTVAAGRRAPYHSECGRDPVYLLSRLQYS
jgi:hypothetical protein